MLFKRKFPITSIDVPTDLLFLLSYCLFLLIVFVVKLFLVTINAYISKRLSHLTVLSRNGAKISASRQKPDK